MKFSFEYLWSIILSVFLSAFFSGWIITGLFLEGSLTVFCFVVVVCFMGTTVIGIPVSVLIHYLIQNNKWQGMLIKLVMHAALGAGIVFIYFIIKGYRGEALIDAEKQLFLYAVVIHAILYFTVFSVLKKGLKAAFFNR